MIFVVHQALARFTMKLTKITKGVLMFELQCLGSLPAARTAAG